MKKLLLLSFLFISFYARAQYFPRHSRGDYQNDTEYGVSLQTFYDAPVANFGYTFKPTVSYGLSLLGFDGHWVSNVTVGYQVFKPKLDTFYYKVDDTSFGTIHYQDFTAKVGYVGFTYNVKPSDSFWIFAGLNLGGYLTHFAYHSTDKVRDDTTDLNELDVYIAPRFGFTYLFTPSFMINLETKYNSFAPTGKASDNDRVGTLYNSVATGISVAYKF